MIDDSDEQDHDSAWHLGLARRLGPCNLSNFRDKSAKACSSPNIHPSLLENKGHYCILLYVAYDARHG